MKAFLQSGAGIWATIILSAFSAGFLAAAVEKRDQLAAAFTERSIEP